VKCQSTLPPAVCGSVSAIGAVTVGSMLCVSSSVDMIDPLLLPSYAGRDQTCSGTGA
jgi:hypothetical protein